MEDNQFSIKIKNFIGNFGGAKTVYWGMKAHKIVDNGFSFALDTGNFFGIIMVSITEPSRQDEFCLSYLSAEEMDKLSSTTIDELANKRTTIIRGSKIAEFIDNINKGYRAPQGALIPKNGSNG